MDRPNRTYASGAATMGRGNSRMRVIDRERVALLASKRLSAPITMYQYGLPKTSANIDERESSKLKFQIAAFVCTMLLSFGSHYAALTLGALKNTIKEELGIDNTKYGILQSSVSLVNTVLPLLGGLFVDCFGTTTGSLVATTCILLGNIVVALSTNMVSFPLMVLGRAFYGLGSGTIVIVQETIISQWFSGKGLALTLGINLALSRLASFLGMATIIPIANYTGFYGNALWFAAFLCLLSWIANFIYYTMVRSADRQLSPEALAKLKAKKELHLSHIYRLPAQFWLVILLAFLMMGGWNTFLHINSELIKLRFGNTDELAAWKASASQVFPIFAPPLLGLWIEKYGKRPHMIVLSSLFFFFSMTLIGFTDVSPLKSMLLLSLSLALGVIPTISSIPLLLPSEAIGTGFGLYKSTFSIGSVIMDIVTGKLQDDSRGPRHSYDWTMMFMVAISIASIIVALVILFIDLHSWKSYLSIGTVDRRIEFESEQNPFGSNYINHSTEESNHHPLLGDLDQLHPLWYNTVPPNLLLCSFIISWVLFIYFFF